MYTECTGYAHGAVQSASIQCPSVPRSERGGNRVAVHLWLLQNFGGTSLAIRLSCRPTRLTRGHALTGSNGH